MDFTDDNISLQHIYIKITQYSSTLYTGIMRLEDFGPKLLPQLDIYFLTVWEHWLGIAKPKNVFLNPSI